MTRKHFGHDRKYVAGLIGVSRAAIHQWETGKTGVSEDNLRSFADNYGVGYEWLAFATGPAPDFAMLAKRPPRRSLGDEERLDLIPFLQNYSTIEAIPGPQSGKTFLAWRIPQAAKVLVWRSTADHPPLRRGDFAFVDTSKKGSTSKDHLWLVKIAGEHTIVREPAKHAKVIGRVVAAFTAL
jgi:transcriptional regulator with XRE-family HTH domain